MTNIIGDMVPKPGLGKWQVEQGIKAAMQISYHDWSVVGAHNLGLTELEKIGLYISEICRQADSYRDQAALAGTAIHAAIAALLRGEQVTPASHGLTAAPIAQATVKWMNENDFVCEQSEYTFVNRKLGFAGSTDWLGWFQGNRCLLDIKTQELEEGQKASYYDEHPLQLAGYALGLGEEAAMRVSLVVSRKPGIEPQVRFWSTPSSSQPEPNLHWNRYFLLLLETWKHSRQFYPEGLHVI